MTHRTLNLSQPPSIEDGFAIVRRSNNSATVGMMVEAAFHESGHAVVSLALGGDAYMTEIYWTKRKQQAHGAFGSCGIGSRLSKQHALVAKLAGPIAASLLTGYVRTGDDYPRVFRQIDGATAQMEAEVFKAEADARNLIRVHWPAIERLAASLLCSRGTKSFSGPDIWPMMRPGTATPESTLHVAPVDAKDDCWPKWIREAEDRERHNFARVAAKICARQNRDREATLKEFNRLVDRLHINFPGHHFSDSEAVDRCAYIP